MKRTRGKEKVVYYYDEEEEEELDLTNIDVEEEEEFTKRPPPRCNDMFLNTLCGDNDDYIEADLGSEDSDDEVVSDDDKNELEMEHVSDDEGGVGVEFCTHDPTVKWNKMRPVQGERYESPQQLKLCLTNYAIANGYNLRFHKCDTVRVVVRCGRKSDKNKCSFRIWASWMTTERSFQIKTMVDEHRCIRSWTNSALLNPTWIARQFLKDLIRQPNLKCKDMIAMIQSKFHYKVSWSKCYRARCRAMTIIEGKLTDHYGRVWDYAHELMRSNPGSTIKVSVTVNPNNITYFHRMYICFNAMKVGWKKGCRRVIGLDGCFLKGQCKGQLLTAIGRDGNNQVYPIAWAVVDVENKVNWKWFLEFLDEDLALDGRRGLCVISDQHKGLLESTKEILPHVEHRQCARHIYANFRKVYSGLEFKNMFWATATSTVVSELLAKMEDIKRVSPGAYDHLMSRQLNTWCRAYFSSTFSCEAVENGITECFNSIILEARKKPLITMLEEIRLYLMDRYYKMSMKVEKWNDDVSPAALKKMKKFEDEGVLRNWVVCPSGPTVFETRNGFDSYCVDIEAQVCTCRLWELSGIPCVHAQACILFTQQDPKVFINFWFRKEKFKQAYETNLIPINGSKLWEVTPYNKPLPPIARRMPGRPSTKRRRHVSEREDKYHKVPVSGRTVMCTNCQQKGHNRVSCKNPSVEAAPKEKKKMGRPRLEPDVSHWTRGGHRGPRVGARGGLQRGGSNGVRGGSDGVRGGSIGVRGGYSGFRGGSSAFRGGASGVRGGFKGVRGGAKGVRGGASGTRGGRTGGPTVDGDLKYNTAIIQEAKDLKYSDYSDDQIIQCLGITQEDLDTMLSMPDIPDELDLPNDFPQTQTQDDGFVDVPPIQSQPLRPDNQVEVVVKKRKPSERILKRKLAKHVADKHGTGTTVEKAHVIE